MGDFVQIFATIRHPWYVCVMDIKTRLIAANAVAHEGLPGSIAKSSMKMVRRNKFFSYSAYFADIKKCKSSLGNFEIKPKMGVTKLVGSINGIGSCYWLIEASLYLYKKIFIVRHYTYAIVGLLDSLKRL
jgi:hypothetical protein